MNISLTTELEEYINAKVASGMYPSASEVIKEGLRLLKEQDEVKQLQLEELKKEVMRGKDAIDRGEYTAYSSADELLKEVISDGQRRLGNK
jgi:antitoxin ParD1/3/4